MKLPISLSVRIWLISLHCASSPVIYCSASRPFSVNEAAALARMYARLVELRRVTVGSDAPERLSTFVSRSTSGLTE
eukprot:scaffold109611_cov36-Phaeocystis_antarctica.AAC.1